MPLLFQFLYIEMLNAFFFSSGWASRSPWAQKKWHSASWFKNLERILCQVEGWFIFIFIMLVFSLSYFKQVCSGNLAQLLTAIVGFVKYIDVLISWYYKTKHWLGKKQWFNSKWNDIWPGRKPPPQTFLRLTKIL